VQRRQQLPYPNSESKHGNSALPAASHFDAMQKNLSAIMGSHDLSSEQLYDWLRKTSTGLDYGEISIRFTIHQGVVTRVRRELALTERPLGREM